MTRIVERSEVGPQRIRKEEVAGDLWICRCGLSRTQPFCDSSHRQTRSEQPGVLYRYTGEHGQLVRRAVRIQDEPRTAPDAPPRT